MKDFVKGCAIGICSLIAVNTQYALADDDKDKAAIEGAAVALGIAAIADNEHHHRDHEH